MNNDVILCTDAEISNFAIFDFTIAPELLLYSYVPIALLSLLFGIYIGILKKSSSPGINSFFFLLSLTFSLHVLNEIFQWVVVPAGLMNFGWGLSLLFHALITFFLFYFVYAFVFKKLPSFKSNLATSLLLLPVILFLPTELTILGFDPDWCGAIDGPLWIYVYFFEFLVVLSFIILAVRSISLFSKTKENVYLNQSVLLFGAFLFAAIFFGSEFLGSLTHFYEINFVGPIGMLLFLCVVTFMIVRFKTFNIKLAGAQALVLSIVFIISSQLFFVESFINTLLVAVTIILSIVGGYLLIKSVNKEIKQREEIESLATNLSKANARLREVDKQKSEFVSIASHQLRSPLTAIRGYASLILEGSYGPIPEKAKESLTRIEESAKLMAMSVGDYLNVSRIESGNMKYVLSDFNINDSVSNICDDLRPEAMKRQLILLFRSDLKSRGVVHADVGKTHQIIHNLINNSIKYTPKGSISVFVRDDIQKKRVYIDITDTGIGMSDKTLHTIFQKFERANNANSVNVSGTGLGLYIALKMAEAMGGDITGRSEGDGKGSRFTIEMPLVM